MRPTAVIAIGGNSLISDEGHLTVADQFSAVAEARRYIQEGRFKPGSMLPKVQAVVDFLEHGGKEAIITDPSHLSEAFQGRAGTHIVP